MSSSATSRDPRTVGRVRSIDGDTLVLALPGTDYRLHLRLAEGLKPRPGEKVSGLITVNAQRLDAIPAGGTYIEPVFGRPRRLQGRVVGAEGGRLLVSCGGAVFACHLTDTRQSLEDFAVGGLVSFDVERGATLELR